MVQRLPMRRRNRRILLLVAAVILLFLISISTIVRLYTDLQWYREVHFTSVFWTILRSEVLLGLGLGSCSSCSASPTCSSWPGSCRCTGWPWTPTTLST